MFEGADNKASGVLACELVKGNCNLANAKTVRANKGVVLAAGAIMTPVLLQLSGVGDSAFLTNLGVKVVKDNPAVGANFVDRNVAEMIIRSTSLDNLVVGPVVAANETAGITFELEAGGSIATEFAISSLGFGSPDQRSSFLRPLFKFLFRDLFTPSTPSFLGSHINKNMMLLALQHETHSKGTVKATSLDITDAPEVDANYYADNRDVEFAIEAYKELARIARTGHLDNFLSWTLPIPFASWLLPDELRWFLSISDPFSVDKFVCQACLPESLWDDLPGARKWLQNSALSHYHYFGTASVGTVVRPSNLEVIGTSGLHVVDASIYSKTMRVNPQHMLMAGGHYFGKVIAGVTGRL
jgi:choline dehydrogenase-like flavoprotein